VTDEQPSIASPTKASGTRWSRARSR
jgi:hypothetical protein